jgi:hypothetical protein
LPEDGDGWVTLRQGRDHYMHLQEHGADGVRHTLQKAGGSGGFPILNTQMLES